MPCVKTLNKKNKHNKLFIMLEDNRLFIMLELNSINVNSNTRHCSHCKSEKQLAV